MEKRARKKKKNLPIKPDNHLRILPRFDKEVGENDDVQKPLRSSADAAAAGLRRVRACALVVQPRPLLQQIVIKDVPAVSADEARKSHSKQRVQCPVRRCTQSLLREKLKKHIEGQHARVAIVVVPTHASVHNMEAAALGPDEADERAEVRKTRLRLAGTCQ